MLEKMFDKNYLARIEEKKAATKFQKNESRTKMIFWSEVSENWTGVFYAKIFIDCSTNFVVESFLSHARSSPIN